MKRSRSEANDKEEKKAFTVFDPAQTTGMDIVNFWLDQMCAAERIVAKKKEVDEK